MATTLDADANNLIHLEYPEDANIRVSAMFMVRCGPVVAAPRILETCRKFGIKQTFFLPAGYID